MVRARFMPVLTQGQLQKFAKLLFLREFANEWIESAERRLYISTDRLDALQQTISGFLFCGPCTNFQGTNDYARLEMRINSVCNSISGKNEQRCFYGQDPMLLLTKTNI
jgi:hypothetical protein